MILLDVNVLVQVHREDADQHSEVESWLLQAMKEPVGVGVTDLVLSGCLRVITHPKVFREPTPLAEALGFIEDFRERNAVHVLAPGPNHWSVFMDLCRRAEAVGNHVPDAYHAAVALEYGCEWISLDRGFSRYPGLRWRHPLDPVV